MEKQTWFDQLDDRQQKEVKLAREYADNFAHGTDGHHRLLLIAKMADLLDDRKKVYKKPPRPPLPPRQPVR